MTDFFKISDRKKRDEARGVNSHDRSGDQQNSIDDPVARKAAAGDHEAFEQLFRMHCPWVYGRLCRMLGRRTDIDDLVQEVFLRAYRSLPTYRGQAKFESWLRRICARVVYDEIRSKRKVPKFEVIQDDFAEGPKKHEPEQAEAIRHLMKHIETLPANNRIVLLLHDVEGYTAEEIRLVIGVKSVNTVRSRLRLARTELHRRARSDPALSWMYESKTR